MQTEVLKLDRDHPAPDMIARAAVILGAGGLVAFPTETVYGLGANALDVAAVARIFAAKGRPAANPLIVHVPNAVAATGLAASWPDAAARLAQRFWPGPLTLVLNKNTQVPDIVTAGGATVAVRVPAHPVALALLKAAGVPLAAPSANRSSELSPTSAEHVLRGLAGRIDMVLDAGPTSGGLESTVLDVTTSPPRLLRPGLIAPTDIETIIGPLIRPEREPSALGPLVPRSPGMLGRHYAPRAPLECVSDDGSDRVAELCRQGLRVGWLTVASQKAKKVPDAHVMLRTMPSDPPAYAAELYAALHELDHAGVDRIVVVLPPSSEEWLAVHDRLRRASFESS
jgi:L-threonylcarbamoyladenylate synthase